MRNPRVSGSGHLFGILATTVYCLLNFFKYESLMHIAALVILLAMFTLSIKKRGER